MDLKLKVALVSKRVRQTRMAFDLGWDPAKLSRIVNQVAIPTAADRAAIASYLGMHQRDLFPNYGRSGLTTMGR